MPGQALLPLLSLQKNTASVGMPGAVLKLPVEKALLF